MTTVCIYTYYTTFDSHHESVRYNLKIITLYIYPITNRICSSVLYLEVTNLICTVTSHYLGGMSWLVEPEFPHQGSNPAVKTLRVLIIGPPGNFQLVTSKNFLFLKELQRYRTAV